MSLKILLLPISLMLVSSCTFSGEPKGEIIPPNSSNINTQIYTPSGAIMTATGNDGGLR